MDSLSYKTISANKNTVVRQWYVVDAENQTVGRLASKLANIIRGKHKASFTPHVDCGDKVIVLNAGKVRFTGKKLKDKEYQTFSGYPGGQKIATAKQLLDRKPTHVLYHAVKGMLPKNKLQAVALKNLLLFEGSEHPHAAQQPKPLKY
ncbi:MAG: 50S ribosomal protein L13 [Bacteroidetes bacterium]|jgi:large subunit ribosomal protein L13|nr:50S ribosomal protein L13 [Bacteroidota bacterium]